MPDREQSIETKSSSRQGIYVGSNVLPQAEFNYFEHVQYTADLTSIVSCPRSCEIEIPHITRSLSAAGKNVSKKIIGRHVFNPLLSKGVADFFSKVATGANILYLFDKNSSECLASKRAGELLAVADFVPIVAMVAVEFTARETLNRAIVPVIDAVLDGLAMRLVPFMVVGFSMPPIVITVASWYSTDKLIDLSVEGIKCFCDNSMHAATYSTQLTPNQLNQHQDNPIIFLAIVRNKDQKYSRSDHT